MSEFGQVFERDGIWPGLLRRAEGSPTAELKCESTGDWRHRVRDFWSWHRAFEIFRERFAEDFARFDRDVTDELVEKREFVGAYYEADGDDLVSA